MLYSSPRPTACALQSPEPKPDWLIEDEKANGTHNDTGKLPLGALPGRSGRVAKSRVYNPAEIDKKPRDPHMLLSCKGLQLDESRWRKRTGITADTKVFIMTGWYPDVKRALTERGWRQNPDLESPFFDMQWMLKSNSINHEALRPHQIVNHFGKASNVTTKSGLMHNLRSLRWFENVDVDTFFPRCYDLADMGDYADFVNDYKCCAAEAVLKRVIVAVKALATGTPRDARTLAKPAVSPIKATAPEAVAGDDVGDADDGEAIAKAAAKIDGELVEWESTFFLDAEEEGLLGASYMRHLPSVRINRGVLKAALAVTKKRFREVDEEYIDNPKVCV